MSYIIKFFKQAYWIIDRVFRIVICRSIVYNFDLFTNGKYTQHEYTGKWSGSWSHDICYKNLEVYIIDFFQQADHLLDLEQPCHVIEYLIKLIKDTRFFCSKHRYLFIEKLKPIIKTSEFSHLFIFLLILIWLILFCPPNADCLLLQTLNFQTFQIFNSN